MPKNRRFLTWVIVVFMIPALACSLLGGNESASSKVSLGANEGEDATPTEPPIVEDVEEVKKETPTPQPEPESVAFPGVIGVDQFDTYHLYGGIRFTFFWILHV